MGTLHTADGVTLDWTEGTTAPAGHRGQVLLVHGLGEHGGRYVELTQWLRNDGWAVTAYDQRGHGRSSGRRGAIPTATALLEDLTQVVDALRLSGSPGPLVLVGHSLGGLLAARFVAEGLAATPAPWWRQVDALVLSSPALDPGLGRLRKLALALMFRLAPDRAAGNGLNPAWISRDPAVVRAYSADPLVHNRITARLARFVVDSGRQVQTKAAGWRVPTLLLYAGADRCVAPAGSAAFAAAAPQAVVEARRFVGLAHEIFHEPEQAEVLSSVSRWLKAHFAPIGARVSPSSGMPGNSAATANSQRSGMPTSGAAA